ncbi:hypothetical protein RhiirA4_475029 [Rhizophagus irregularis]|uniref:Uncharacterized protein n=1 Tax=Rhizophagus irregularis TaxID=588596 RepID=A0A2I1H9F4_9GLOM|nr:hypothetical protein RhiirA4_475029 [Rhizophagus irregularis]
MPSRINTSKVKRRSNHHSTRRYETIPTSYGASFYDHWMPSYYVKHIGCANVSQNNPLEKNGFLIIFSDQKLYIGRVIAIYENIGGRHRYILRNITNIDAISYISVSLFIDVYNGLFFTNDCQIGGKLFAHIIPKEVIYYFGKPDTITFQNNSILTLNEEAL